MLFTRVNVRGHNRNRVSSILGSLTLAMLTVGGVMALPGSAARAADRDANMTTSEKALQAAREVSNRRPSNRSHPAWQVAGGFSFGVHNQGIDGGTVASALPSELRGGGDSLITTFFRLHGRLYTPIELHDNPFHPRLYLRGTVDIPIADKLIANKVNNVFNNRTSAGFMRTCPPFVNTPGTAATPVAPADMSRTTNCNTGTRNYVTPLVMWSAGFGVDFTMPVLQRQFHILTGLEYFGELLEGGGRFTLQANAGIKGQDTFAVSIVGDHQVYHGIAVPIGIHVDVYRTQAYTIQLFMEGRAAWKYTERDLSDSGTSGNVTATFRSNVRNFSTQANAGITLVWGGN